MTWLVYIMLPPLLIALAACCAMWLIEDHPRLAVWTIWRRLRGRTRWIAAAVLLVFVLSGADKAPPTVAVARMIFLTVMANGDLRGPTNVIASAAAATAVQAVVAESTNMVAVASNALAWAEADIPLIEADITNSVYAWLTGDIPQDMASSNVVARCDLLAAVTRTNGTIDAYVAFNVIPSSAPIVSFEASAADTVWHAFTAVSNSYPALAAVDTPAGVVSGYCYTVSVPDALLNVPLIPERAMTFGGGSSNAPLGVLGAVMVDGQIGRTVETAIASGITGRFEGGILVGVSP